MNPKLRHHMCDLKAHRFRCARNITGFPQISFYKLGSGARLLGFVYILALLLMDCVVLGGKALNHIMEG